MCGWDKEYKAEWGTCHQMPNLRHRRGPECVGFQAETDEEKEEEARNKHLSDIEILNQNAQTGRK